MTIVDRELDSYMKNGLASLDTVKWHQVTHHLSEFAATPATTQQALLRVVDIELLDAGSRRWRRRWGHTIKYDLCGTLIDLVSVDLSPNEIK